MSAATVKLTAEGQGFSVTGILGPNGAVPTEGYGGWDAVARPRRQALTVWNGRNPFKMTLQIVFDGFVANKPVEVQCSTLERFGLPPTDGEEPPALRISCAAVPHTDLVWVVDNITWEDVERRRDGKRIRQVVTLSLLRHNPGQRLAEYTPSVVARQKATAAARAAATTPGASVNHKPYVVKDGDTLQTIAAHELGDAKRYREIADLNNLRDSKALVAGQPLKMP